MRDVETILGQVRPTMRTFRVQAPGCVVVQAHWKHWPCLLPQHGPGRKHERPIVLEPWQLEITHRHPADFILELCAAHLDLVGVRWRYTRPDCLAVSRRADVARLDALIGLKS